MCDCTWRGVGRGTIVIAHEIGHHVQNLLGATVRVRQSQGQVVPESFTHGSSQQRQTWLRRSLTSGRVTQCNTFSQEAP